MWKPKRLYLSPEKQNPGLSRRSTEGAHATCGGPYLFHHVRALSPSFFLFNESNLQVSFISSRARPLFHRARVLYFQIYSFLIYLRRHPPIKRTYDGQLGDTVKHRWIVCVPVTTQILVADSTQVRIRRLTRVSSHKHRTKGLPRCASRPRPTSSPTSSCSSAESARATAEDEATF